MEQITIVLNDMEDVKREIDNCQRKAVKSVVELGYILRKADDAELFREAGYSSIFKFAEAEYGWNQSQTSRFMRYQPRVFERWLFRLNYRKDILDMGRQNFRKC